MKCCNVCVVMCLYHMKRGGIHPSTFCSCCAASALFSRCFQSLDNLQFTLKLFQLCCFILYHLNFVILVPVYFPLGKKDGDLKQTASFNDKYMCAFTLLLEHNNFLVYCFIFNVKFMKSYIISHMNKSVYIQQFIMY